MLFKNLAFLFTLILLPLFALAQGFDISGTLVDQAEGNPLTGLTVQIIENNQTSVTDEKGEFKFKGLPSGTYTITVQSNLHELVEVEVILEGADQKLGSIEMVSAEGINQISAEDIIPTVTLSESDLQSDGGQSVSGLLTASRDVFINAAAFTFGSYRFRIRGYDSENTEVLLNGLSMNDMENGRATWSQWGGLNDVMRNRESTVGLDPTFYTFGGVGGATNIDTRAADQWKQLRLSYSGSNRSYNHRLMATYSTGVLPKGWAVSVSGSRRWAEEGFIEGTSYDAWSYFLAVEKKIGDNHSLNLTGFGAYTKRGRSSPSVQEALDLSGSNFYNPNWGMQDGEKRNARIAKTHIPTGILTHEWQINKKQRLFTSAGYQAGVNGGTALNWYNASDPRPDYYRNLPSFIEDSALAALSEQLILDDPDRLQIDWDELYQINYNSEETIENYNGTGRDTTVNLSRYIIEDRRFDRSRFAANVLWENNLSGALTVQAGANYNWQRTYNFKEVADLLGGAVFVDLNEFAERDFPDNPDAAQNDLNNPNRLLAVGDRYGYDYDVTVNKFGAFAQADFTMKRLDFFVSANVSRTQFWRTGNYVSGLFPDNSLGDSEKQSFVNYGVKGGATYKINGRNYFFANGAYLTRAPYARNAFLSPRTRNSFISNLKEETIATFEGGYLLRSPKIKARAVFYFTQFNDGIRTFSFYNDFEQNFVNINLSNIDKRHLGGEFAVEGEVAPGLKISGVAALGQYIFNSRQSAEITLDNSAEILDTSLLIYSKNFFIANGPQMAATIGLNYRSPKYWFVSLNFNYFDRIWLDFNPIRRTEEVLDNVAVGSEQYNALIDQQQADGQFTMDLFAGASWKLDKTFPELKRSYFIYFTLGINNITNNTNFITGGFEQTRLDTENRAIDRFPPRNFYAYGVNFFAQISFRM